ncbi:occlusion derived virus envelope protein 18 [Phthorimaea operculella granulovirus]|uniref:Occlusion derived virus envelope protein 18 n=1 Tax=Phthorimaea operculella granulovirus TaxID=192584 RepID=Q8JS47_9BBAC|nr:occlusion derived virus envelope protein 18 [Phthorimaea operculella granulovirus]AAM70210.1 occlusion derived virus envelope protein 18 [Phthorimaea operculella granulovirus]ANY57401.1 occlusion derived virus envelope protein 18 [Phthorimaea operculella granulovirus]QBH65847.1 occlusion derived virus envelope protein 18 [Phthorimaea operculella granulovirus]QBH65977.1 occlusion derived virus envelope protein 18 [Phthorimaea operculella granulovirus]QBH66107.1 occlusion derived virus envelo
MDTFRGETGVTRRIAGLEPNMLMTILVVLVIIILLVLLFNMSSGSDSSGSGPATNTRAGFFNPLNNTLRNNPVVTTATTTRAV